MLPCSYRAREIAVRRGDRAIEAEILLDEAMALDWIAEWRRSRELAERAQALVADLSAPSPLLVARLKMSLGRSATRFNEDDRAVRLLRDAAVMAEPLGAAGYETVVVALILCSFIDALSGRLVEAAQNLDRVVTMCREHRDQTHLGSALNNRTIVWLLTDQRDKLVADATECTRIARHLGNAVLEKSVSDNVAGYYFALHDFKAAETAARRVMELDQKLGCRPCGTVLMVRILWTRGDEAASQALLAETLAEQDQARREGRVELALVPSEEILLKSVDLALRGAADAEWDALVAAAEGLSVGPELIEIHELRGLAAYRRNDLERAHLAWTRALALCDKIPNPAPMTERIRRQVEATDPRRQ